MVMAMMVMMAMRMMMVWWWRCCVIICYYRLLCYNFYPWEDLIKVPPGHPSGHFQETKSSYLLATGAGTGRKPDRFWRLRSALVGLWRSTAPEKKTTSPPRLMIFVSYATVMFIVFYCFGNLSHHMSQTFFICILESPSVSLRWWFAGLVGVTSAVPLKVVWDDFHDKKTTDWCV